MSRKNFQRLSQDTRRRAMIEATLEVIARHGLSGATVRRIADEADITAGLIRHYFSSKDELIHAAYTYLTGQLTSDAAEMAATVSQQAPAAPAAALSRFIQANVSPPNLSEQKVSLWATFIGRVRQEPRYSDIHRESYRDFLELLQTLIHPLLVEYGQPATPQDCKTLSIALNGLIDGLWLEGSLAHGLYNTEQLPAIALQASERLLGLPENTLTHHLIHPAERS